MLTPEKQIEMIMRGTEIVINEKELKAKLYKAYNNDKPMIIKLGLDPSSPNLHLGHTVVLRKARLFQELGHSINIIIGDFTGRIGDPTGKSKGRMQLSEEEVTDNAKAYCQQIFKVLDEKKTIVHFNHSWLNKLKLADVLEMSTVATVAKMLERNDFKNRYDNNLPIGIHEFFYPLLQAYDSHVLGADVELGGVDQLFNILLGRDLQKKYGQEEQVVLLMPLLEGIDGVEKMSKSTGNYIGINDKPEVMFKKIMEIPDSLIERYYILLTDVSNNSIKEKITRLKIGENPKNIKYELACDVVSLYYNYKNVQKAEKYFRQAFTNKSIPDNIPVLQLQGTDKTIADFIEEFVSMNLVKSKSDFKRLVLQNGIQLNSKNITLEDYNVKLKNNDVIKIGKKRFVRFFYEL